MWSTPLRMLAGALLLALALEALFRILPVSGASLVDYHDDPQVLTYPPHHGFTWSTGWDLRNPQRLHANNAGFVADQDFQVDPRAVALVGDSHIEASALAARQRPAAQLQQRLGEAGRVYAMGSPGTSLLDYAERVRLAHTRYGVRDMVVLVDDGDIRQSVCGSGQVAAPCLDSRTGQPGEDRRPAASALKRALRHSALAQYLFSQLKVSPERMLPAIAALPATLLPGRATPAERPRAAVPTGAPARDPQMDAMAERVTRAFFDRIRPHVSGRLVILVDRPFPGDAVATSPQASADRFAAIARAQGATVIDMAAAYAEHAARSPLKLAIGPYDGHHNPLGAALLAQEAARGLAQAPRWQSPSAVPGH